MAKLTSSEILQRPNFLNIFQLIQYMASESTNEAENFNHYQSYKNPLDY